MANTDSLKAELDAAAPAARPALLLALGKATASDSAASFGYLQLAQEEAERLVNLEVQVGVFLQRADYHIWAGQQKLLTSSLFEARKLLEQLKSSPYELQGKYLDLRSRERVLLGLYKQGEVAAMQLLKLARQQADSVRLGKTYQQCSHICERKGNFDLALAYADTVRQIGLAIKDSSLIGSGLNNIGVLYSQLGAKDDALAVLQEAVDFFTSMKPPDSASLASAFNNISIVHMDEQRYDSALFYLKRTMAIDSAMGYMPGLLFGANNIGRLYRKTGHYEKAERWLQKGLRLATREQFTEHEALLAVNLAQLYLAQNKLDEAETWAIRCQNASTSLLRKRDALETLSDIKTAQGDFEQALELYKNYILLADSATSRAANERYERLRAQFEMEQQEQSILALQKDRELREAQAQRDRLQKYGLGGGLAFAVVALAGLFYLMRQQRQKNRLLASQNEEISRQRGQIEETLAQREVLLKEVHHRVKNNLQVISSLLSLQSASVSDETALNAIQNGQARIMSMALVHKHLYQGADLAVVDFSEYVHQLVAEVAASYGAPGQEVAQHIKLGKLELSIDSAVPIGLILNELLTNSFKHAFSETAENALYLEMERTAEGTIALAYRDSGPGFPANQEQDGQSSLGMRLIRILTRQLKGNLTMLPGSGAAVQIEFRKV